MDGIWLRHAQISPWYIRLIRKGRGRYHREVNEVLEIDGRVEESGLHFDHHPFAKGIGHWIQRHVRYARMEADRLLEEGPVVGIGSHEMSALHVPGHCQGSLCFYFPGLKTLVGGDVLFCGGVGRWDLPGGDGPLLFEGIRKKIFTLDPETVVLPGHGPATTVGRERTTNPFVSP